MCCINMGSVPSNCNAAAHQGMCLIIAICSELQSLERHFKLDSSGRIHAQLAIQIVKLFTISTIIAQQSWLLLTATFPHDNQNQHFD